VKKRRSIPCIEVDTEGLREVGGGYVAVGQCGYRRQQNL
jgi:hypothetical protein